jgi:hypothetical protein
VVSTALFNKGDFRYPFMVMTYAMQLLMGQSPLQGAQSTIYAATGGAARAGCSSTATIRPQKEMNSPSVECQTQTNCRQGMFAAGSAQALMVAAVIMHHVLNT